MSIVTNDSFLQWDPAQVSNFIDSINDAEDVKHGNYFLENNIEGSLLPFITTEHLKEIGIEKLSSRLVIKKKISELINQHLEKNPPKSFNDPQYKLNNININNNYISIESLNFSTVLMKDMIKKVTISLRHHQSQTSSPIENQQLDMKKLNDNFIRLKSDLIPVIRLLKDSKPLPTPTLDPGYGSNIGNLDSPTYSISSAHSSNSNTLFDTIQDAVQSTSNRNSNPLPSPTQSNRFSSGSLLSLGTGKIIQSNNGSATMLNNNIINNSESNPVDPNSFNANTMSGNGNTLTNNSTLTNNKSRPRLVESKSTGATSTFNANNPISAPKTYRKHSSSTSSTVGSLPSATPQPQPASVNPGGFTNAEPLKQLRASTEDSCLKILQQAMKRHHVPRDDWSKYVLVICYGDKERILKLAEKPVPIFKELQELGKHPAIMLRQLAETKTNIDNDSNELYEDSRIGDEIPGGTL